MKRTFALLAFSLLTLSACNGGGTESSLSSIAEESSVASIEEESSSSSEATSFEYSDEYYRLSPADFGEKIYSFDQSTCTFAESEITISIDQACLSAEEVCYYYLAFETLPPNYFTTEKYRSDTSSALEYGKAGRCASRYCYADRPDGYAVTIGPYYNKTETSYYWEFDIDLDGTYNVGRINRGAGRVVVVADGLEAYGGDGPVCFFTEDHYDSFREFYNYEGGWGPTFTSNAEKINATTLSLGEISYSSL